MKTKIMTGVLAGVISSAAFAAPDVAAIKAACQSSDKTIWVEKNQICIPANPCTSDNMNAKQYCNTVFADDQTGSDNEAMGLVDLYAKTHGLDCEPVNVQFSAAGQDYVTCVGNDVMVFEFDDTRDMDHGLYRGTNDFYHSFSPVCEAAGGDIYQSSSDGYTYYDCYGLSESVCSKVQEILFDKHGTAVLTSYNVETSTCCLSYVD